MREGTPHGLTTATGPGGGAPPAVTFGAPPALDVVALAAAVGPGTVVTETTAGRYRVEAPGVATPAVTAAVANFLAARGATLTDLVAGRTLEDVYFETVGAAADQPRRDAAGGRDAGDAPAGPEAEPVSTTADALRPLTAQTGAEVFMTLRRGETLLLTLGIPVVFLLFFSKVSVVSTPTATPANFFVPGILALAVMSTAMVSLGIATGFERGYGVLKRLGATPLGRPRLLGAKIVTIVAVELLQAAVLLPVGLALGWNPGGGGSAAVGGAIGAMLLGSAAFAGIGLLMAGTLRAEVNLAAANGLYLILLLLGGMIVPISKLPSGLADFAKLLPAEALSSALHATLGRGVPPSPPSRGPSWRSGPSRRPSPPRSRSAGNEGALVRRQRRRRQHGAAHDLGDGAVTLDEHGVGVALEVEGPARDVGLGVRRHREGHPGVVDERLGRRGLVEAVDAEDPDPRQRAARVLLAPHRGGQGRELLVAARTPGPEEQQHRGRPVATPVGRHRDLGTGRSGRRWGR